MAPTENSRAPIWLLVSFLLGLAAAGLVAANLGLLRAALDPLTQTTFIVLAAALVGLSCGPWLPQGLIRFVSSHFLERVLRHPGGESLVPLTAQGPQSREDRKLLLAASCFMAAFAILLTALLLGLVRGLCEWLRADFFWVPGILRLVDFAVALAVQFVPLSLLGIALVSALGIGTDRLIGRSTTHRLVCVVSGAGLGFCAVFWWFGPYLTSLLILLLSAIPALVGAIVALWFSDREPLGAGLPEASSRGNSPAPVPELGGAGSGLLLGGLAVWALSLTMAGVAWFRVAILTHPTLGASPYGWPMLWLAGTVVGAWFASPRREATSQTLGSSGLRMCLAGLGVAAAVVICCAGPGATDPRIPGVAICLHGLFGGQVLPAILRGILSRFATRGLAYTAIVTALTLAAAAGLLVCGFGPLSTAGTLILLCGACLLLVIAGGIMIIYDPLEAGLAHRFKLVGVFASLALLILVLPVTAPRWQLDRAGLTSQDDHPAPQDARTVALAGNERASQNRTWPGAPATALPEAVGRLLEQCLRGTKACLIGEPPGFVSAHAEWLRKRSLAVDHWPHVGGSAGRGGAGSPLARLRMGRRQFDLAILGPAGKGIQANRDLWTVEAFARLAGLIGPDGLAVVRLRPAGLEPQDIRMVARTFLAGFRGRVAWLVFRPGSREQAELWLLGCGPAASAGFDMALRAARADTPQPIGGLLKGSMSRATHSAEHPRLRADSAVPETKLSAETAALLSLPTP